MCIKQEFIDDRTYEIKLDELIDDYLAEKIDSLDYRELDDTDRRELAALYLFVHRDKRETAEETLIDAIRNTIDDWVGSFMWGALESMGYGDRYTLQAHETVFTEYMDYMGQYIQEDIDTRYSERLSMEDDPFAGIDRLLDDQ